MEVGASVDCFIRGAYNDVKTLNGLAPLSALNAEEEEQYVIIKSDRGLYT